MTTKRLLSAAVTYLLTVLIIGAGIYVWALQPGKSQEPGARRAEEKQKMEAAGRLSNEIVSWASEYGLSKSVKGAPFSAQVVVENTQTLANGTHISQKMTGALYRDSEGRIRS